MSRYFIECMSEYLIRNSVNDCSPLIPSKDVILFQHKFNDTNPVHRFKLSITTMWLWSNLSSFNLMKLLNANGIFLILFC